LYRERAFHQPPAFIGTGLLERKILGGSLPRLWQLGNRIARIRNSRVTGLLRNGADRPLRTTFVSRLSSKKSERTQRAKAANSVPDIASPTPYRRRAQLRLSMKAGPSSRAITRWDKVQVRFSPLILEHPNCGKIGHRIAQYRRGLFAQKPVKIAFKSLRLYGERIEAASSYSTGRDTPEAPRDRPIGK